MKSSRPVFLHIVLAAVVLGACQYMPDLLPKPFQKADTNDAILTTLVQPSISVAVLPPAGPPDGVAKTLAASVAEKSQGLDIPATNSELKGPSYKLDGIASAAALKNEIVFSMSWDLISPKGENLHHIAAEERVTITKEPRTTDELWTPFNDAAIQRASGRIAIGLKKWFDAQKLAAHEVRDPVQQPSQLLTIANVEGAPGDGNAALTAALMGVLQDNGQRVSREGNNTDTGYLITGEVTLEATPQNQDSIRIAWNVLSPSGDFLGTVAQANTVTKGSLSREWGSVAQYAALAASGGILDLISDYEVSLGTKAQNGS